MKVSIHQPQYLPWIPYFSKIDKSDLFICLDSVDFQKNGFQNRNQIKTPSGPIWLTVPVYQHLGQKILDVKIETNQRWARKHFASITQSYSKAPYFKAYRDELQRWYEKDWIDICSLNIEVMETIMRWMKIETPIKKSSQMKSVGNSSELILNLCLEVGATCYLSGVASKGYLCEDSFSNAGVEIHYLEPTLPVQYPQMFPNAGFENTLSVIDILFSCGDSWRTYIPTY